jgi:hypothetical protein
MSCNKLGHPFSHNLSTRILVKFCGVVGITSMLLSTKNHGPWMHKSREKCKMVVGDMVDFSQNINWFELKFFVFIPLTLMHFWSKFHSNPMHSLQDTSKSIYAIFFKLDKVVKVHKNGHAQGSF